MITADEKLLTREDAAPLVPKVRGRKLHANAVWRWMRIGVGPKGHKVKLESVMIAGRLYTSEAALWRFFNRTGGNYQPRPDPSGSFAAEEKGAGTSVDRKVVPRQHTPRQRERDLRRAERVCDAAGI